MRAAVPPPPSLGSRRQRGLAWLGPGPFSPGPPAAAPTDEQIREIVANRAYDFEYIEVDCSSVEDEFGLDPYLGSRDRIPGGSPVEAEEARFGMEVRVHERYTIAGR